MTEPNASKLSDIAEVNGAQAIIALMQEPTEADKDLVRRAYAFARAAHEGHKRLSGEPYTTHLIAVAEDLARINMSATTIAAGLLHDCVEDMGIAPETIEKEFGKQVRFLVEGVTKLGSLKYHGTTRHVESLRKLLVATSKDVRVLIIKLMDRLHNMRTLKYVRPEKRTRIALETLEIHAAIAHRLGMGMVRRELEDLAFEYAYPKEFAETKKLITEREKETQKRLNDMSRKLKRALAEANIKGFEVDSRVKGIYSLWQKLKRKGGEVENVHDIAALRVIVNNVADCYHVLGIVHGLWQPLPNKIKDYIRVPKPNGYQSLHTTVFSGDGGIVEIQIRTHEMHDDALFGVASHVSYKENGRGTTSASTGMNGNDDDKQETTPTGKQSSFDWVKSLMPRLSSRRSRSDDASTAGSAAEHRVQDRRLYNRRRDEPD
ncbi:MAG TPA: HD domain-containing protein, partial [Candidatus Paceibacterota bacterium]